VGDNGPVRQVINRDEAFVADGDLLIFGAVDENAMEGGAGDHDGCLSAPGGVSGGHAGEEFAALVFEGPLVSYDANVAYLFDDAGRGEDVHAVGGEAEGSAGIGGAARSFEDLRVEAGPFEE
jgi:hypothetical protein